MDEPATPAVEPVAAQPAPPSPLGGQSLIHDLAAIVFARTRLGASLGQPEQTS